MSSITQIPLEAITKGKKIGSGARSDVFFGNWKGKPVAIKELKSLEETTQEALAKEASLLTTLKHPNIVAFHGLINKTHHFVFSYIANGSLHSLIMDKSTATWKKAQRLNICKDMTKGLTYLHSQNVIHRDFKSPNILIDEHFRAIISDFGISKIVHEQTSTQTGGIGTLAWMAPEQFESGHYKASIDIYALGLVIWEVFEEKQPFKDLGIGQLVTKKHSRAPGEEFTEKTPENLHELLKNCWQKASKRPTAEGVLNWLESTPIEFEYIKEMREALERRDLETLERLIALERAAREPIVPQITPVAIITTSANSKIPETAFGAKDWNTYLGDVGEEPPLPPNIEEILQNPCPFWPDQKVRDTHFLCLIPKIVNGNPLTLDNLQELVKTPKQGSPTKYSYYLAEIQKEYGSKPVENSYWVLMTKDVIPGSRKKSYEVQKALVEKTVSYEMPKLIEAAVVIFMHIFKTGDYIYTDSKLGKQRTYTRCLEKNSERQWPLAIGDLSAAGLGFNPRHFHFFDHDFHGVGGARKFF